MVGRQRDLREALGNKTLVRGRMVRMVSGGLVGRWFGIAKGDVWCTGYRHTE